AIKSDKIDLEEPKAATEKKADKRADSSEPAPRPVVDDTGYKSSERTALENQLLQIETAARAASEEKNQKSE
ncbi:MAG: hypothetical protein LBF37_01275, partial [Rickettsiales bacterium]|nr:hypothetical protein [Rickettsiales bacterium]